LKYLSIIFVAFALLGCDPVSEIRALEKVSDNKKVWVYAQFNVREDNDGVESYYYYGKVSKSLYDTISQNRLNRGFILLEEVKYWGSDDLLYDYKDRQNSGEIVFRIENIARMAKVNKKPIVGKGFDQFMTEAELKDSVKDEASAIDENPRQTSEETP
jgi:hypothetical protein